MTQKNIRQRLYLWLSSVLYFSPRFRDGSLQSILNYLFLAYSAVVEKKLISSWNSFSFNWYYAFRFKIISFQKQPPEVFLKKTCFPVSFVTSQNSLENTCARVSFLIKLQASACNFDKETLAQVFCCEFCEISKNIFFTEYLWATVSVICPDNFATLTQ